MREVKARTIVEGDATGPALMSPALSFLGDVDIRTGNIVGDLEGVVGRSVKGQVLVMPHTRGSAGSWRFLYQLSKVGTNPVAIITDDPPDPSMVQGAILAKIPVVCSPEIKTADFGKSGQQIRVIARDGHAIVVLG